MAQSKLAVLEAQIATLTAQIAALSAPATSAPATFATSAAIKAGTAGFACTASPACSRVMHTEKRAAVHGVANGGHEAR